MIKIHLFLFFIIGGLELAASEPKEIRSDSISNQAQGNMIAKIDSSTINTGADNASVTRIDTCLGQKAEEVSIKVDPKEAGDATIVVVRKSVFYLIKDGSACYNLEVPDTLGMWKAPLNIPLFGGDYDLIAKKEGFREAIKEISLSRNREKNFSIDLVSIPFLQEKRFQWSTIKWISGAVAAASSALSYYFNSRINAYTTEYSNAVLPDVIQDKRNKIDRSQRYFSVSTTIAFTAWGGFGLSWIIEKLYE
jgi:hypothetical protein